MLKKALICPSNSVKIQISKKIELKTKNLEPLSKIKKSLIFLRYRDGYFHITILPIISQNQENGGIYT